MIKRTQRQQHRYDIARSPLYGLSNKRKLAQLLGVEAREIANVVASGVTKQYNVFRDKKTRRFITEPQGQLAQIHKRLLKFLCRIAPPDYVHSAIKRRSYKTNAEAHASGENVLKIDIKKFFPSVKFHYVHNFFLQDLRCSQDVATILAKLCTVETKKYGVHLPTGSCISPILSFLANRRLFDSIKALADEQGCEFTVYVDDIAISGEKASRSLLTAVAKEIHKFGYRYHKIKTYHAVPATVTGLIVYNSKVGLPFQRAKKIREYREALGLASCKSNREKLLASLVGRLSEAEQIDPRFKMMRQQVLAKYAEDWAQVVAYRARKAKLKRKLALRKSVA